MNCPTCDLPLATNNDYAKTRPGQGDDLCWRAWDRGERCENPPVDWRARALDAEAQLDEAHLTVASIAAERDASLCREGRTFIRSMKRRSAVRRLVQHYRGMGVVLDAALEAGIVLGRQVGDRDDAIEALTRRVAELMPCHDRVAFADGELDAERAAAFRLHLRGCPMCRERVTDDSVLSARLSTLRGEP